MNGGQIDDLDAFGVVLVEEVRELLHGLDRLEVRLVHLPVGRDDRLAFGHDVGYLQDRRCRAARDPRGTRARRPRRSRRDRTGPRARTSCTAARLSPPPTTVKALRVGDRLGDAAGPGAERLELEHAHRAVPQDRLGVGDRSSANSATVRARCRGPLAVGNRAPGPSWRGRRPGVIAAAATTSSGSCEHDAALVGAGARARGPRRTRRARPASRRPSRRRRRGT